MQPIQREQMEAENNESMMLFEQQLAETATWKYEQWVEFEDIHEREYEESMYFSDDTDETDMKCVVCNYREIAIEYGSLCSTCFSQSN